MLLKTVEETNITWIASSVSADILDKTFQKRFTHIRTQLPTKESLSLWLAERCEEWNIGWIEEQTLILLAEKANLVPGDALRVLARADKKSPRVLTRKLVEGHLFIL